MGPFTLRRLKAGLPCPVFYLVLAICSTAPRVASASACSVPSDCFSTGEVCHLGICVPCEMSYQDGGLEDPLFACQDPTAPVCDIPDGSVGGACVQCIRDGDCQTGETCDLATNTCTGLGVDGGPADASTKDGATGSGDASIEDGGTSPEDGSTGGTDGATEPTDGAAGLSDGATGATDGGGGAGDGSVAPQDASSPGASDGSASEDGSIGATDGAAGGANVDGGGEDEGAFVEGGGCACEAIGGTGPAGGAFVLVLVGLAAVARRRSR